jgi:rsbT antagonist protein RsbS
LEKLRTIPIIKLGNNLIVSIQVALHDRLALKLQDDIAHEIVRSKANGLIIDVSAVEIIDSFIARTLNDVGKNSKTMGAETVIVGLQPAVAITLVEMGMEMKDVHTALDLDDGLKKLRKLERNKKEREED